MFRQLFSVTNTLLALAFAWVLSQGVQLNSATKQQPRRLPAIERSILNHAGGAIELEIPADWTVYEWSQGRRVHAIVMPPDNKAPSEYRRDGLWLSHTALPPGRPWEKFDFKTEIDRRLALLSGKPLVIQRSPPSAIGPWEAHSVVYSLTELDHAKSDNQTDEQIIGGLMLVRTAWGVVEINGVAPRDIYESRQVAYEQIVRSIKLDAPMRPATPPGGNAKLLGSWKSERARIRMYGDGRFEILLDAAEPLRVHPPVARRIRPDIRQLLGRYTIEGDLIRVAFADNSRSNYRWSVEEGELLLTDHEGRVSELARIYE